MDGFGKSLGSLALLLITLLAVKKSDWRTLKASETKVLPNTFQVFGKGLPL